MMKFDACLSFLSLLGIITLIASILFFLQLPFSTSCTNTDLFVHEGQSFTCDDNNICNIINQTYLSYIIRWKKCSYRYTLYINTDDAINYINDAIKTNNTRCYYNIFEPCKRPEYKQDVGYVIGIIIASVIFFALFILILATVLQFWVKENRQVIIKNNIEEI